MDIYVELDNNYGDLREYNEKWNSTLQKMDKTKKMYSLQEILDEYESLYNTNEDLSNQIDELNERIKELENKVEELGKGESNE